MSRDERDQAGGHPNRNPRLLSCLCCVAITDRGREKTRSVERQNAVFEGLAAIEPTSWETEPDPHVYFLGRCIRCNVRELAVGLYPGTQQCPGKDDDAPVVYSTSSDGETRSSHPIY